MLETTAQSDLMNQHSISHQANAQTIFPTGSQTEVRKIQSISPQIYTYIANARALYKNGEYDLALNLLRQASNHQAHELVFKEMAVTLILKKSWTEARMIANKWHSMFPSFDSSYTKAQIEYEMGFDDQSLQTYFESLSLVSTEKKELFDIFKNIGNIYVRKGDFESAEEFYNKAYALNGHSDILYVNYGILEMQRGELNKAKDRFRTALHINSDNDKAWTSLAMVHFEFGDEDLGVANIKRALDINPSNKTAISFAYQKMAQRKHAEFLIETMQKFLDQADFDEEVSCLLIQKLYEMGRFELAILECNRLLLWNPLKEEYFNLLSELESQVA